MLDPHLRAEALEARGHAARMALEPDRPSPAELEADEREHAARVAARFARARQALTAADVDRLFRA